MRILIFGGLGMLGHQVYKTLSKHFTHVFVSVRKPVREIIKYNIYNPQYVIDNLDLLNHRSLEMVFKNTNPDIVINCVSARKEKNQFMSNADLAEINGTLPVRISDWCKRRSAQFIHFSSDDIFKGRNQPYSESSSPDSSEIIGRAKALGETLNKKDLIFRSHFIGQELELSNNIFSKLVNLNSEIENHIIFSPEKIYSGVTTFYMSNLLTEIILKQIPLNGLFHVGALHPINEMKLVELIISNFKLNIDIKKLVKNQNDSSSKPVILSSNKLIKAWPHNPPLWSNMINDLSFFYNLNKEKMKIQKAS